MLCRELPCARDLCPSCSVPPSWWPGRIPSSAPPELKTFAQKQTIGHMGVATKVGYLLKSFFAAPEEGGLGITYDNAYTRTPIEAWRDRKANCPHSDRALCGGVQVDRP